MNHVLELFLFKGETATGFEKGQWTHWGNAQHISMFLFFGTTEFDIKEKQSNM
jgi:hypothetical protein